MSLYAEDDSGEPRFRDGSENPEYEFCECGADAARWSAYLREFICADCIKEREPIRLNAHLEAAE